MTDIERSPNTVRAYAGDLRHFSEFVELRGYDWADVGPEELGDFAGWLRSPAENVVVLPSGVPPRGASTVNRKLAAVAAFYDFHHRQSGVPVAEGLSPPSPVGSGVVQADAEGVRAAASSWAAWAAAGASAASAGAVALAGRGDLARATSVARPVPVRAVVPDGDAGRAGAGPASRGRRHVGEPDRDRMPRGQRQWGACQGQRGERAGRRGIDAAVWRVHARRVRLARF